MRNLVIPHEHGGWAMVSVPFLFGMLAGRPGWMHLPLFLAWLFLYLASYPIFQAVKRKEGRRHWIGWGASYGAMAIVLLIPPLIGRPSLLYFGLPLLLLLAVNVWHVKTRSERALANDLCAVLLFSLGGAASYLVGGGGWDVRMGAVVLFSFLHFAGSVFFVKSVFRERKNKRYTMYAKAYHAVALLIPWAVGYPFLILSYLYSAVRAFALAGRPVRPGTVGIIEIAGVLQFLLLSVLLFRL